MTLGRGSLGEAPLGGSVASQRYTAALTAFGGLTCRYKLDETGATSAVEASGGTAGIYSAASASAVGMVTDGGLAQVLTSGRYLSLPNSATGSFQTLIFTWRWVSGTPVIFGNNFVSSSDRVSLVAISGTQVQFNIGQAAGTGKIMSLPSVSGINIMDGLPHHFMVTSDGTTWKVYIDGVYLDSYAVSWTWSFALSGALLFCYQANPGASPGQVDDIACSTNLGSLADAQALYKAAFAPSATQVVSRVLGEALVQQTAGFQVSRVLAEALLKETAGFQVARVLGEALVAPNPMRQVSRTFAEALVLPTNVPRQVSRSAAETLIKYVGIDPYDQAVFDLAASVGGYFWDFLLDEASGSVARTSPPSAATGAYVSTPVLAAAAGATATGTCVSTNAAGYIAINPPGIAVSFFYKYVSGSNPFIFGNNGGLSSNRVDFKFTNSNADIAWMNGTTTITFTGAGTILGDGNWHHVTLTFSGATPEFLLDGVSKGSQTNTTNNMSTFNFGRSNAGNNYPGRFDHITFWSFQPSAAQVLALIAANAPSFAAAGSLSFSGTAGGAAPASGVVGSLSFSGTAGVALAAGAAGALALSGAAGAAAPSGATGSMSLSGSAGAVALAAALGSMDLSAVVGAGTQAGAAGSLAFAGSAGADVGFPGASGVLVLTGTVSPAAVAAATGSLSLSAQAGASASPGAAGDISLTMFVTLGQPAAANPHLDFDGTAGVRTQAGAAGHLDLLGSVVAAAQSAALGHLDFAGLGGDAAAVAAALGDLELGMASGEIQASITAHMDLVLDVGEVKTFSALVYVEGIAIPAVILGYWDGEQLHGIELVGYWDGEQVLAMAPYELV